MFCFKEIGDVIGFPFSPTLDIFTLCSACCTCDYSSVVMVTENINVRVFSSLRGFLKLEAVEFT